MPKKKDDYTLRVAADLKGTAKDLFKNHCKENELKQSEYTRQCIVKDLKAIYGIDAFAYKKKS